MLVYLPPRFNQGLSFFFFFFVLRLFYMSLSFSRFLSGSMICLIYQITSALLSAKYKRLRSYSELFIVFGLEAEMQMIRQIMPADEILVLRK